MTLFALIAVAMLALALWFVLPALLRQDAGAAPGTHSPREALNLTVLKDQLQELDQDFHLGTIGHDGYQSARQDLTRRVAEEVKSNAGLSQASLRQRSPVLALALGIPLATVALYAALGSPRALVPIPITAAGEETLPSVTGEQITGMVARLAERLKSNPDDAEGWLKLVNSYETLQRFDLAVQAYQHLITLRPNDPDLLTNYAVTLAMSLDQSLSGAPEKLILRALDIDRNHIQALALLGSAAFERQDYAQAIKPWQKILDQLPANAEMAPSITANIAKARALAKAAGMKKAQP